MTRTAFTQYSALLCVLLCVCLSNPVSLPAAAAAKHAGSSRGRRLPPLCLSLVVDRLLVRPADCDTEREREREGGGDGGNSDGVSCHFLFLYQSFFVSSC